MRGKFLISCEFSRVFFQNHLFPLNSLRDITFTYNVAWVLKMKLVLISIAAGGKLVLISIIAGGKINFLNSNKKQVSFNQSFYSLGLHKGFFRRKMITFEKPISETQFYIFDII